jgi:prepilin-type processing-associated H-X9-DG protein
MRRWVYISFFGLLLLAVVGIVLTLLAKARGDSNAVVCTNNLREITLFAAHHAAPKPGRDGIPLMHQIPAGTIILSDEPPENRLSWLVPTLPGLDQKRQNMEPILAAIDKTRPWSAERNRQAAKIKLRVVLCPGAPPDIGSDAPAPTQYVGIAGLGADAATLTLDPLTGVAPPRAGCFRYDAPTPFEAITDGLSQTILLGERSSDLGPWLQGGPSTVRGIDDAPGARLLVGPGGQFGGCHLQKANWAFADGSVRFLTEQIDPKILYGLATIAGKDQDPIPGE